MATDKKEPNVHLHIKFIYLLITVLCVGFAYATWICLTEIRQLRSDLDGEIAALRRGDVVEFAKDIVSDSDSGASVSESNGGDVTIERIIDESNDDLVRVRRGTKRRRSRPSFFTDGNDVSEGSGSSASGDWVWLTSYSRIPVFALKEFCASTQDHCPSGAQGPPGIKGEIGEQGLPGRDGWLGDKGEPGEPGPQGFNGTEGPPGQKGEPGNTGLIGLRAYQGEEGYMSDQHCIKCPAGPTGEPGRDGVDGLPGAPGFNGTNGAPGRRGKRGRLGKHGPKGDRGEVGPKGDPGDRVVQAAKIDTGDLQDIENLLSNCTCDKGQKGNTGQKGKRGLIGFIGYKGEPGDIGPRGPPGPVVEGPPGPPGPPGPRGPKGDRGNGFMTGSLRRDSSALTTRHQKAQDIPRLTTVEPSIEPRQKDCQLRMVGKPLFQRFTGTFWGAWMQDPYPKDPNLEGFIWLTRHFTGKILYEYRNFENFRQDRILKIHELKEAYFGTGHVAYRGSLYYQRAGYNQIVCYDLEKEMLIATVKVRRSLYTGGNNYLYSTEYNYFDFAVDQNGLWVIYGSSRSRNSMLVTKVNPDGLTLEKTWNITIDHKSYGNGFIACGILYLVRNTTSKATVIDFAYDLYKKSELTVRLKFTNPFQMNNMIAYNPHENKVYSWDKGNQLTYLLLM